MAVVHRQFFTAGFVNLVYICVTNWGPGILSNSKKLKCITVPNQKELVSWNFVHPD